MSSVLLPKSNNFNAVRLLAALLVIYAHSYAFTGQAEWVARKSGVTHAGELSVVVFFFISGALITKSLDSSRSIGGYAVKRVMRIYPALILCCFLVPYVFSWMFGGAKFTEILASKDALNYFITNSLGVWNLYFVPGIFENHPEKALNGSLWSITLELRLYLALGVLSLLGLMKDKSMQCLVFLFLILCLALIPDKVPLLGNNPALYGTPAYPAFSIIFLIGGLFYVLEDKIEFRPVAMIIFFAVLMLWAHKAGFVDLKRFVIFGLSIAVAMWLATLGPLIKRLPITHDYSYGVYLYGWPSQQIAYSILVDFQVRPTAIAVTAIAMPLALLLAALSWHLLEKPSLNFGHRFARRLDDARLRFKLRSGSAQAAAAGTADANLEGGYAATSPQAARR
ncbi:acyltransferase [Achromobacter sp. GD03932]|uniref:acyltransferase family protein n=1 Tax=unclassified Achromobacter TaxID=2626865 RepID=UPI002447C62F|nr:acyltransferase [Achromobacter sp. GD03932]MDH1301119.1 acyltransferase [Achromobacter sp. GD03932]